MTLNSVRTIGRRVLHRMERFTNWIFRTELCMFICVSGTLFTFYVIESFLNFDDNDSVEAVRSSNDSSISKEPSMAFLSSPFENVSTFVSSIVGLYISLFFIWKFIVFVLFGELKLSEYAAVSKLLLRFAIFRFIILSGAINPSRLTSLFGWLVCFSFLGFLHLFSYVIMSRCNQISASGSVPFRTVVRMFIAFLIMFIGSWYFLKTGLEHCFLLSDIDVNVENVISNASGGFFISGFKSPTVLGALKAKISGKKELLYDAVDVIAFLISEFALLICKVLHLALGLLIQAYDRWRLSKGLSWEFQSHIVGYLDLTFVCLYHLFEISHYLHLLLWSKIFSVASLVVFLHIRVSYSNIAVAITRYFAQRRLNKYVANNYELCKANKKVSRLSFPIF